MMRNHIIIAAMIGAVLGASCAKAERPAFGAPALEKASSIAVTRNMDVEAAGQPGAAVEPTGASVPETAGRKLVYRADMSVEVDDPAAAESSVLRAVKAAGGYASIRNVDPNSVFLELRVPVASLESIMDTLAGSGKTRSRSVSAEDVTDQYFDLEGRLKNKRLLEERYRDYLRRAASVEDMLAVEARLSETTNEIERLEGSFRDLGKRIELATLSVSLWTAGRSDPSKPTIGESLARLFAGLADAFRVAVVVIVGLVVYGVPALLVIAALWWLTFGRLGLVRKLFALLGARGGRTKDAADA